MGNQKRIDRLVLVPCPYQGHINPLLQLGKALHSKGFSITIAHTSYNSPNPHDHPEFTFVPLPEGLLDRSLASTDLVATLLTVNENCKEIFKASLERVIQRGESLGETVKCVISDEVMFFAEDVAVGLKLPSLILRTTSAATSFARSGIVELKEQGRLLSQGSLSNEIVPELHPLRFKDLPFGLTHKSESFSVIIAKVYGKRTSSAIIWNTVNCLEQSILDKLQQQCQTPIFPIGPIHKISPSVSSSLIKEDKSCVSWLDKQSDNSVIYVSSLGSIASLTGEEVSEVAWGLANTNLPFLWVIRPGSIRGSGWTELLPEGFCNEVKDRGCIVKWAPQKEVLAHGSVGGFWSHCGWNSTLESLSEGVPMICRPCFGDQRVNARYVNHVWRVGLELEGNLERGEIERAVRRLMLDDEGKVMRERAKEWKVKLEASTTKGGTSYCSLNVLINFIMSQQLLSKKNEGKLINE